MIEPPTAAATLELASGASPGGLSLGAYPLVVVLLGVGAALSLLLAVAARSDANFLRGLGLAVLGLAGYLSVGDLYDPSLDAGVVLRGGAMVRDHLAALLDLIALGVGAFALIGSGRGQGATGSGGAASIGPARRLGAEPLVLAACMGVCMVFHAGDLLTLLVGGEVAAVSAVAGALVEADDDDARALVGPAIRAVGLSALLTGLGVALIYGATASVTIHGAPEVGIAGLSARVASVFTQWGAVQNYALALEEAAAAGGVESLPPGMAYQFRAKVVTGMAPAALFLPGMVVLAAGALSKTPLLPFGGTGRRMYWSREYGAGVSVLAGVLVPLVGFGVLARVFVPVLHASRLVREPYGWVGPLPLLLVVTALVAGAAAVRQRDAARIAGWLSTGAASIVVAAFVVAASFAGRGSPRGAMVASAFEQSWARVAAESAFASGLASLACWGLASAALVVGLRVLAPESTDLVTVSRAARRDRMLALAIAIAVGSLVGIPPLLGGIALLGTMRALVEHTSLQVVLWPLAIAWGLLGLGGWRLVVSLFSSSAEDANAIDEGPTRVREPRGSASTNPGRAQGRLATLVVGVLLVLGGLRAHDVHVATWLAAAGVASGFGNESRVEWIASRRPGFEGGPPSTTASAGENAGAAPTASEQADGATAPGGTAAAADEAADEAKDEAKDEVGEASAQQDAAP